MDLPEGASGSFLKRNKGRQERIGAAEEVVDCVLEGLLLAHHRVRAAADQKDVGFADHLDAVKG